MATTYINSPNGTGTDPQIATFSMWFKITKPEATEVYLFSGGDGGSNNSWLRIQGGSGKLYFRNRTGSSTDCVIQTAANHLDPNGWYHIVLKLNSTLSTAADRAIMYINGQEVTAYSSSTDMTQNNLFHMFGSTQTHIGKRVNDGSTGNVGGFLASHVHFIDGTALAPTVFGSTDATTGEWKINTNPTISSYGTRGFFILKDGNSTADVSPNTNNFTVAGGTLTKTEDCPDNVFCTLNPLSSLSTFSNGNTEAQFSSGSGYQTTTTTLGMTSGKYYCEAKVTVDGNYPGFGICETNSPHASKLDTSNWLGSSGGGIGWYVGTTSGNAIYYNGSGSTGPTSFSTNDIIGMALDLDSAQNTLKYYKNGTLVSTQNISTSSNGWMFGVTHNTNQTPARSKFNFGNGFFGTTAVSSAGTNASGIGIFEYDVPTGYTALSTKGLNL